jgi:hypothetical protein
MMNDVVIILVLVLVLVITGRFDKR